MSAIQRALVRYRQSALARIGRNVSGQDMLEYALLAGFVAVVIGAMVPKQIVPALTHIYVKVNGVLQNFSGN